MNDGTIDLTIGNTFLCSTASSVPAVDIANPDEGRNLYSEVHVRFGESFILQPKQFALASTVEYLALPEHLGGLLQSRSTYGRMGLVAVTAAWVAPGYHGSPTLELCNVGDVALAVRPGVQVCQLILFAAAETASVSSRYHFQTKPYFARRVVDDWLADIDATLSEQRVRER